MSRFLSETDLDNESDVSFELIRMGENLREQRAKERNEGNFEEKQQIEHKWITKQIKKIPIAQNQLHICQLKQRGLYNEEEEEIKRKQRFSIIAEICVNDFSQLPVKTNIADVIAFIFEEGIFKQWSKNPHIFQEFKDLCALPCFLELNRLLFWLILFLKFPSTCSNISIVDEVRERISQEYISLNSLAPLPKEDYLKPVVCMMTYVCQRLMFNIFFLDRHSFNQRMILDWYQLAIYEINGIQTTDFYVQQIFEHYFTVGLFEFEKTAKFQHLPIIKKKNRGGGGGFSERAREFLGQKLEPPMPSNRAAMQTYQEIKSILSAGRKPQITNKKNKKTTGNLNSKQQSDSESSIGSNSNINSQTSFQKKQSKTGKSQKQQQQQQKYSKTNIISKEIHQCNSYTERNKEKQPKKEQIMSDGENNRIIQGNYENICPSGRQNTYGKCRFNLNQVSPTIGRQLQLRDCSLQNVKKKVVFHAIDRLVEWKDQVGELERMKIDCSQRDREIEKKAKEQYHQELLNTEQMRSNLLRDIGTTSTIQSQTQPNNPLQYQQQQRDSSMDLNKTLLQLRIALKKTEDGEDKEVSQSDKFKMQFQSVKEIKKYIDKYGSRVADLPSNMQLFKAKKYDDIDDEEEEQRIKIAHRLLEAQAKENMQKQKLNYKNKNTMNYTNTSYSKNDCLEGESEGTEEDDWKEQVVDDTFQKTILKKKTNKNITSVITTTSQSQKYLPRQTFVSKIKYTIEEKEKLDSSVQFLLREEAKRSSSQGIDSNKPTSSLLKNLKTVKTLSFKEKLKNQIFLMQDTSICDYGNNISINQE